MSQVEYEQAAVQVSGGGTGMAGLGGAGSLIATGPQTMREAIAHPEYAVDKQAMDLDCALENLSGLIDELRGRLDPVLNPGIAPDGDPVRSVDVAQSRVATFIESRTLQAWSYGRALRSLIDRLEV